MPNLRNARNLVLLVTAMFFIVLQGHSQISYAWQNSKEGWVPASETNLGCNLTEQPEAMAMRAYNQTPVMRSGTLSDDLGLPAGTYDRVAVTLKNPTSSGNPNARLFVYPSETNTAMCYYNIPVDTAMVDFSTYVLDLSAAPDDGTLDGSIARFGLRAPWGVANFDTIYWKSMVVYNALGCTNLAACNYEPLAEEDNGSCLVVGDSCDDGDDSTLNDMVTAYCLCAGETDGVGRQIGHSDLKMYPNPASGSVFMDFPEVHQSFVVRDLTGRIWHAQRTVQGRHEWNVEGWPNGIYVAHVEGANGFHSRRFVVTH